MGTFDRYEKIATWIAAAFFFALLAGTVFGKDPENKRAATKDEAEISMLVELGLATVSMEASDTGHGVVVMAPRERVVAFIAEANDDIAFLRQKVAKLEAERDWVAREVLPRYPVPSTTPTPNP